MESWNSVLPKHINAPLHKVIPSTDFIVDGFRYQSANGKPCKHYFLTHFHSDHYGGLLSSFDRGTIYTSRITADLVTLCLGVDPKRLRIIDAHDAIIVEGSKISIIDANHCPGAIMFIFETPSGGRHLHCGDMRYSKAMDAWPALQKPFSTVFLDTTYCNPNFAFPSQESMIDFVSTFCGRICSERSDVRIVVGAYSIGKERLAVSVAERCKGQIAVSKKKFKMLSACLPEEEKQLLVEDDGNTTVKLEGLGVIRGDRLYSCRTERFPCIIGIKPTGWTFSQGRKSAKEIRTNKQTSLSFTPQPPSSPEPVAESNGSVDEDVEEKLESRGEQGAFAVASPLAIPVGIVIPAGVSVHRCGNWGLILNVPYSEHSSFAELRQFVKLIDPQRTTKLIPTVNVAPDWKAGEYDDSVHAQLELLGRPVEKAKKRRITSFFSRSFTHQSDQMTALSRSEIASPIKPAKGTVHSIKKFASSLTSWANGTIQQSRTSAITVEEEETVDLTKIDVEEQKRILSSLHCNNQ